MRERAYGIEKPEQMKDFKIVSHSDLVASMIRWKEAYEAKKKREETNQQAQRRKFMTQEEIAIEKAEVLVAKRARAGLDLMKAHDDFPKSEENYAAWYRLAIKSLLSTDKKVEYTGTIVEKHGNVAARRVPPRDKKKACMSKAKKARKDQKARSGEIGDGDGEGKGTEGKKTEDSLSSAFLMPDAADEILAQQQIHQL